MTRTKMTLKNEKIPIWIVMTTPIKGKMTEETVETTAATMSKLQLII